MSAEGRAQGERDGASDRPERRRRDRAVRSPPLLPGWCRVSSSDGLQKPVLLCESTERLEERLLEGERRACERDALAERYDHRAGDAHRHGFVSARVDCGGGAPLEIVVEQSLG